MIDFYDNIDLHGNHLVSSTAGEPAATAVGDMRATTFTACLPTDANVRAAMSCIAADTASIPNLTITNRLVTQSIGPTLKIRKDSSNVAEITVDSWDVLAMKGLKVTDLTISGNETITGASTIQGSFKAQAGATVSKWLTVTQDGAPATTVTFSCEAAGVAQVPGLHVTSLDVDAIRNSTKFEATASNLTHGTATTKAAVGDAAWIWVAAPDTLGVDNLNVGTRLDAQEYCDDINLVATNSNNATVGDKASLRIGGPELIETNDLSCDTLITTDLRAAALKSAIAAAPDWAAFQTWAALNL